MTRNIETIFDVLEGIPTAAIMDATELLHGLEVTIK